MNIFAVDKNPIVAAKHLHDKHIVKMTVESVQMLSTVQRMYGNKDPILYKATHQDSICVDWLRKGKQNYLWLHAHAEALCDEYSFRYYGRQHKSSLLLDKVAIPPYQIPDIQLTPFALEMPEEYMVDDPINSYRAYYLNEKVRGNYWTNRMGNLQKWLALHIDISQYRENIRLRPKVYPNNCKPTLDQIFVFGSNKKGAHGKGAAMDAAQQYGAVYGQGAGIQGRSYGIITKDEDLNAVSFTEVKRHIATFVDFANSKPHLQFFITRVGCGLAGFKHKDIAPLFRGIGSNCSVHMDWYSIMYPEN